MAIGQDWMGSIRMHVFSKIIGYQLPMKSGSYSLGRQTKVGSVLERKENKECEDALESPLLK